jgi:post-segregation antitoxin (ccd killing protein)
MLNRTVHHSPSSVQVPIPYDLAQNLKAQGHNLHALIVEFLQSVAENSEKEKAKKTGFTQPV